MDYLTKEIWRGFPFISSEDFHLQCTSDKSGALTFEREFLLSRSHDGIFESKMLITASKRFLAGLSEENHFAHLPCFWTFEKSTTMFQPCQNAVAKINFTYTGNFNPVYLSFGTCLRPREHLLEYLLSAVIHKWKLKSGLKSFMDFKIPVQNDRYIAWFSKQWNRGSYFFTTVGAILRDGLTKMYVYNSFLVEHNESQAAVRSIIEGRYFNVCTLELMFGGKYFDNTKWITMLSIDNIMNDSPQVYGMKASVSHVLSRGLGVTCRTVTSFSQFHLTNVSVEYSLNGEINHSKITGTICLSSKGASINAHLEHKIWDGMRLGLFLSQKRGTHYGMYLSNAKFCDITPSGDHKYI